MLSLHNDEVNVIQWFMHNDDVDEEDDGDDDCVYT